MSGRKASVDSWLLCGLYDYLVANAKPFGLLVVIALGLTTSYFLESVDAVSSLALEDIEDAAMEAAQEIAALAKDSSLAKEDGITKSNSDEVQVQAADIIHHGIDISHYQGNLVDEIQEHPTLDFVICKATQGAYYVDTKFHHNWQVLADKGIMRGAYHFYDDKYDPKEQAIHFAETVNSLQDNDIS